MTIESNANKKNAILVVDPMASSEYLVNSFNKLGYEIIALKTAEYNNAYHNYGHLPFAKIITSTNDIDADADKIQSLAQYHIAGGIIGSEIHVEYAERVLHILFPNSSNDPNTSHYRSNKFWMNERLKECNISSINQEVVLKYSSTNKKIEQISKFYKNHNSIVLKPCSGSAATAGVFFPTNESEIIEYLHQSKHALFNEDNTLLQEKLSGIEYFVNTSSFRGKHHIVAIGRYHKHLINNQPEYCYSDNLDLENSKYERILNYALECLTALALENGLCHIEIMETLDGELKLIEINPRIAGGHGFSNRMSDRKYGINQCSAYINLAEDKSIVENKSSAHQRIFYLKNKKGSYCKIDASKITSLQTYVDHEILQPSMDGIPSEQNMTNFVSIILLESNDLVKLEKDTMTLISLEQAQTLLI